MMVVRILLGNWKIRKCGNKNGNMETGTEKGMKREGTPKMNFESLDWVAYSNVIAQRESGYVRLSYISCPVQFIS